ncbi:hypothetical protein [Polyangium jinanense]|uniref:Uncharacterized protein n=1 Tax=Polyangium jinanense TaxID=2829994 RepID=A0A9X4AVM2_9BACT|nr:hypothetical protein [Polyangium jinanense]MDC3961176.1 hypothetical protein [Polyangium jinanense]MDC3986479.1 hypothetical protein [Polyangium jinanense]
MNRKPRRATRIVALVLASLAAPLLALGCGGSVPSPGATGAPPQDPAAALDQAEREVHSALGLYPTPPMQAMAQQATTGTQPTFAAPPPAPPPLTPTPAPTAITPAHPDRKVETEAKRAEAPSADEATPVSDDPCMTACRALQSMGRAATHLCDLAGEDDARCASAKDRVRKAEDLVRQRCPACAG